MPRGECDQVLEVNAKIKIKTRLSTLPLEVLEHFQCTAPFSRNLRQREVGATQLSSPLRAGLGFQCIHRRLGYRQRPQTHLDFPHRLIGRESDGGPLDR
jgi:hypothetical protein